MTKAAKLSAFLCPGMGQWAAGKRGLGSVLVLASVVIVASPFVRFFWGVVRPPPCDPWKYGITGCAMQSLTFAWRSSWMLLVICILLFVPVYAFAVWHANRLTLPGETETATTAP